MNDLSIREQGSLLIALRGCDAAPKMPYDQPHRILTSALRNIVLAPADAREVDSEPGCFGISFHALANFFGADAKKLRASDFGYLPIHYVMHLFHAVEIVGYRYPDAHIRAYYEKLYRRFVDGLHLVPESKEAMIERLTEDRIAAGSVVS